MIVFIVTVYLITAGTYAIDPNICCDEGHKRAEIMLQMDMSCNADNALLAKFSGMLKTICIGMFRGCCNAKAASTYCERGIFSALNNRVCLPHSSTGGERQKICCECCKMGKAYGLIGGSCFKEQSDALCSAAFQRCCNTTKTGDNKGSEVSHPGCNSVICSSRFRKCIDSLNGPRCVCKDGLREEGNLCVDINECNLRQTICPYNSVCSNTEQSYVCICNIGFEMVEGRCVQITTKCDNGYEVKRGKCQDINECITGTHGCPKGQFCLNTDGYYTCESDCPYPKYEVISPRMCQDVNECKKQELHNCPRQFKCVNHKNGYRCERVSCDNGFILENGECQDIDECASKPDICGKNGNCKNTQGWFVCSCHKGYAINSTTGKCADIDECKYEERICHHHCINSEGSFKCECPDGYIVKDGLCIDVDECQTNPCPESLYCFNTYGSYECINETCPNEYYRQTVGRLGGIKNCRKIHCDNDSECSSLVINSIKRSVSKFYNVLPAKEYVFEYDLEFSRRFYTISFRVIGGNEDNYFAIEEITDTKIRIINTKEIIGPKAFHIILNTDVTTSNDNVLRFRYVYHFYIYLAKHNFS